MADKKLPAVQPLVDRMIEMPYPCHASKREMRKMIRTFMSIHKKFTIPFWVEKVATLHAKLLPFAREDFHQNKEHRTEKARAELNKQYSVHTHMALFLRRCHKLLALERGLNSMSWEMLWDITQDLAKFSKLADEMQQDKFMNFEIPELLEEKS